MYDLCMDTKGIQKEFRLRNSRAERGRQSRQNTIRASVHYTRRAFYCIRNMEEFPMQLKKRQSRI